MVVEVAEDVVEEFMVVVVRGAYRKAAVQLAAVASDEQCATPNDEPTPTPLPLPPLPLPPPPPPLLLPLMMLLLSPPAAMHIPPPPDMPPYP